MRTLNRRSFVLTSNVVPTFKYSSLRCYSSDKVNEKNGNILSGGFNYLTDGVNNVVTGVSGTVGGTIGTFTNLPKSVTSKILDEAVGTLNTLESKIDDKNVDISITFMRLGNG